METLVGKESQVLGREGWNRPGTRYTDRPIPAPELCASAYVRRDNAKIRNDRCLRKRFRAPLKRFYHHKNNDDNQQDRGYFVDNTIEFLRVGVAVGGEILNPTSKKTVHGRQRDHQREL